jgi:hypothetical protein
MLQRQHLLPGGDMAKAAQTQQSGVKLSLENCMTAVKIVRTIKLPANNHFNLMK